MESAARGHRQIDHTADLCLEVWAPSEAAALAEAARALVSWLCEEAAIDKKHQRLLVVEGALDREDRLVQFLNEVLYLAQSEGFLTTDAEIVLRGDTALEATLLGEDDARDRVTQELKSVTYHDLQIEECADGAVRARFVVDI